MSLKIGTLVASHLSMICPQPHTYSVVTFDSGDHAYWVGGPDEVFGIDVASATKRLMGTCRSMTDRNTPRLRRWRVSLAKKPSTALSQDAEVGVKWNVQRGCRASHWRTFGCLWVA